MTMCPLCQPENATVVFVDPLWRVIRVADDAFPGYYRVIWNAHVAEFSELTREHRVLCLEVVTAVESALRTHLQPTKINLASLGNVVPHLHWHVIARFSNDSHFPQPVWGSAQRESDPALLLKLQTQLPALDAALVQRLEDIHHGRFDA